MRQISSEMLIEARAFSDWRLYAGRPEALSALDALTESAPPPVTPMPPVAPTRATFGLQRNVANLVPPGPVVPAVPKRSWKPFNRLSPTARAFGVELLAACEDHGHSWGCFNVDFTDGDAKVRVRVQELDGFYACKQLQTIAPDLDRLKVKDSVRALAMSKTLKTEGGLLLCVGETSTGKTTTATAVVRARLRAYGGYCLALADPPELPIGDDGSHNVGERGYVDEVDVSRIGYREALRHALRSFPVGQAGMLFYGEIRSDSNASDLINIACDGQEVMSTMHAMSPDAAIERLISWSVRAGEPIDVARAMLAQSLRGIIYHRIDYGMFSIEAHEVNDSITQSIREGRPLPFKNSAAQTFRPRTV